MYCLYYFTVYVKVIIDDKFASGMKNVNFGFYPSYTDMCRHCILSSILFHPFYTGVFCPVQVTHPVNKTHDYFVDGGMLCNYPIHCFDGKVF